jgi:hypothetical protein
MAQIDGPKKKVFERGKSSLKKKKSLSPSIRGEG